jgi:AGCS family alanine or glycine:cation symporter
MSMMIVLLTGVWQSGLPAECLVQAALGTYFPYMDFFMPFFIFLLGYSTIIAYFVVGLNCAQYLSPKWGKNVYYVYAVAAFVTFSFVETHQALSVMAIVGCLLLVLNAWGIFKLTKEIRFDFQL